MYVLVETDIGSKTSTTVTFSDLDELAAWVHSKVPATIAAAAAPPVEDLTAALEKARALTAMLESFVPTAAATATESANVVPVSEPDAPPPVMDDEDDDDEEDEDDGDTEKMTTYIPPRVKMPSEIIVPMRFFEPSGSAPPTAGSGNMDTLHPDPQYVSMDIVEFGESMYPWVMDKTPSQRSTMRYNPKEPASHHVQTALSRLQGHFYQQWCEIKQPSLDDLEKFKALGGSVDPAAIAAATAAEAARLNGTARFSDVYALDEISVSSPTMLRFLWVLMLNFPNYMSVSSDLFVPQHAIDILKNHGNQPTLGENLRTYYEYHTIEYGQKLDVRKCRDLFTVLHRLKCNLYGFRPWTDAPDDNTWERFLFHTLFLYFKNGSEICQSIVDEWVAAFMRLKTHSDSDSSTKSSVLYTHFETFLDEVLAGPSKQTDTGFPFMCTRFREQLGAFLNPKLFARAVKKYGTSSVRRAAGVFYAAAVHDDGKSNTFSDAQLDSYNSHSQESFASVGILDIMGRVVPTSDDVCKRPVN